MRTFGIVVAAVAVLAAGYFCVDMFGLGSKNSSIADDASGIKRSMALRTRQVPHSRQAPRMTTQERVADVVEGSRPARGEEPSAEGPTSAEVPDRTAELASRLDLEYAADSQQTRESYEREKAIDGLFSKANLGDKAHLQDLSCREKICRGTISISNDESDRDVFERTLLSEDFARLISDAVSVASRQKLSDGSVLATFFIHPQSVFEDMASP
jgi:hypothetical protein